MFGGSAFGNTNQPNTNTGGAFGTFGSTTGQTNTTGTGLFGSFGQNQQQQQQQQQQQPSTGFGIFGQPQQQQQPAANTGTSIFGGGGAFAQNNQAKPAGGAFGAFNNRQSDFLFFKGFLC